MSQIHGTWPSVSFKASATLAAYVIVKPGTGANLVALHDTNTAQIIGVTQQASVGGANSSVLVALNGCAKVTAGASVSSGAILIPQTATGFAVEDGAGGYINTATALANFSLGLALDAGDTNSTIEVLLRPQQIRFDFV